MCCMIKIHAISYKGIQRLHYKQIYIQQYNLGYQLALSGYQIENARTPKGT